MMCPVPDGCSTIYCPQRVLSRLFPVPAVTCPDCFHSVSRLFPSSDQIFDITNISNLDRETYRDTHCCCIEGLNVS